MLIVGYARRGWGLALAVALAALVGVASSAAAMLPSQVRVGAAPRHPFRSRVLGALSSSTPLQINVTLKPRDPAGLASYAAAVSTPGSSVYHRYLTVAQFRQRFGPSATQVASVEASLRAHGLTPGAVSANGLAISVAASASRLERAFSLSFDRVALPSGRIAFANTQPPEFDSSVAGAVQSVVGLDSISVPQPQAVIRPRRLLRPRAAGAPAPRVNTGGPQACAAGAAAAPANYAYTADQLASAYQLSSLYGAGDEGAGQTIALFELEPYSATDIAAYQACYGTSASLSNVNVDGGPRSTGPGSGESALDIEDVIGLAPRANVIVYQGPNTGSGAYDTYAQMVNDDRAQVISTSWGLCEANEQGTSTAQAENSLFEEAAAQGQSVFAAAGDNGSEDCGSGSLAVDDPASQPYVTGVGGTKVSTLGPPPAQSVWNESSVGGGAGGGGISTVWTMPAYQADAPQSLNVVNGSSSGSPCAAGAGDCREVPDVSADADPYSGYLVYYNGGWTGIGGTSAAAPLWAAFMALVNASSACAGHPVGFANPALYAAAAYSYSTDFGDVTTGNNDYTGAGAGAFAAGSGYDMASGLGTPNGSSLPADLCSHSGSGASTITVTNPGTQTSSVGSAVSLQVAASDSTSASTLTYAATGLPPGLAIDATSGLISGTPSAAGASAVTVTVSDTTGASRSVSFTWLVSTRATGTTLACSPSALAAGATTTCTATTSDTGAGAATTPAGTVRFASSSAGSFSGGGSCALAQVSVGSASCSVTYQPLGAGTPQITAGYSGDASHSFSSGAISLSVSAPPPAATTPPPAATAPPRAPTPSAGITGTPRPGNLLSCPPASAIQSYQWTRDGTPIAGASEASYRVEPIDEGNTLTCVVAVASAAGLHAPALSASVYVPVPPIRGCPAASGRAAGTTLGLIRLGMTRRQARRAYAHSSDRASRNEDTFCLTPFGLHAGYASSRLRASAARADLAGRVVWLATGSAFYAIDGVRVGARLSAAKQRLKLGKALTVAGGRWYLAPAGGATVALKVRGGIVQEVAIASRALTGTRAAQRKLIASF